MKPRHRSVQLRLSLLVTVLGVLGSLLVPLSSSAANPDPSNDRPRIPKRCSVGFEYLNPHVQPCNVNRFQRNRPTLVLWGDSHALQMLPAVRNAVRGRGVNLAMMALGSCPALKYDSARGRDVSCRNFNVNALKYVKELKRTGSPVRVIVGSYWQGYRQLHHQLFKARTARRSDYPGFVVEAARVLPTRGPALLRRLARLGIQVDVLGQIATVPGNAATCARGEKPYVCDIPRGQALPQERATSAWLARAMRSLRPGARLIDPNPGYCYRRICKGMKNGVYTFFDVRHISATRAGTLTRYFVPSVQALKRQR